MWNTVPAYYCVWLVLLQLAVANGGQTCTFYMGSAIATYCESNCCGNICCKETNDDTRTASIVLGVVAAVIFLIIVVVIVVVCCFKYKCLCQSRKKKKHNKGPISDNVISIHEVTEEKVDQKTPQKVRWMQRETTFSIFP